MRTHRLQFITQGTVFTLLTLTLAAVGSAIAQDNGKKLETTKPLVERGASPPTAQRSLLDPFLAGVEKRMLPNGLTVLTREQKGLGVVALCAWVKAGYFHEPDEVAGMAHLFEHMLFKGSKSFPGPEAVADELATVGGLMNAGTTYDHTHYFVVVPKEGLRRALEIQADAIMNPSFDPVELKKEAEVVIEESNRKLDNPPALSVERMYATAFTEHRMKRWRIGSNEVLRSIRRPNLLAFFEELYRPENIVLVISGDIAAAEAHRAALETFGALPRGELKKQPGPVEPPQTAFRHARAVGDIRQGYAVLGWHTPGAGHTDELALGVLAQILGEGFSSRLFTRAVGDDAASTIAAEHRAYDDVGVFQIQASFDEKNRAEAERRTVIEVARIKAHGPVPSELARAINATESKIAFGIQDALGQALTLARYESLYGYQSLGTRLVELRILTVERIRDVARRYLTTENLTLYQYAPLNATETRREEELARVLEVTRSEPGPVTEEGTPPSPTPLIGTVSEASLREMALTNGATLVVMERPGAPLVSLGVYFGGGRIDEDGRNAGITRLMAHSMRSGTATRSAEQISREIEFFGSQIGFDLAEDYFGFTLDIQKSYLASVISLLADVVLNPAFRSANVIEEKSLQMAEMRRSLDNSQERPHQLLLQALYANHPYALPATGYAGSLGSLDPESLRAWWKGHVVGDEALICVVGDITAEEARRFVQANFGALPRRGTPRPAPPMVSYPASRTDIGEYRSRKQSAISLGFPTVPRSHEDWPALRVIANAASGWKGTLFAELRGRRSLAYTVYARQESTTEGGAFVAYMGTDAAKEKEAREALVVEIRKLAAEAISEKQLALAKSSLAGVTRIYFQTNAAHVAEMARNRFNSLPLDFSTKLDERTQSLTLAEVRRVAAKYLTHDRYVEAIVHGKAEGSPQR